jgi:class 3 adenylate cyclase
MTDTDRQLKAILFSDVKSFSAMMSQNEERTMRLIKEHREIVREVLPRHGGEEHGTAGDSFFVLFSSAVKAVQCAVEIQEAFHKRNKDKPAEEQIWIRIGIHIGDIIVDRSDGHVYGEGINIAARTEPQAEPGGICITQDVFQQVQRKIDLKVISIGRQEMKNIVDAPELFRIIVGQVGEGPSIAPQVVTPKEKARRKSVVALVAIGIVVLLAAGMALFVTRGKDRPHAAQAAPTPLRDAKPRNPAATPVKTTDAVFAGKAFVGRFAAPSQYEGLATAVAAMFAKRLERHYKDGVMTWSEAQAVKGAEGAAPSPDGAGDPAALAKLVGAQTLVLGELVALKGTVWVNVAFYDAGQGRIANRISGESSDDPKSVMATLESGLAPILSVPPDVTVRSDEMVSMVQARIGLIKYCYERELRKEPKLRGKLVIKLKVDTDGTVKEAQVKRDASTLRNEAMYACVEAAFLSLNLGRGVAEAATFEYPFMFVPAGE